MLYRLFLAEKLREPWRGNGRSRTDPAILAAREAASLEAAHGPGAPLGLSVTILLIGLSGTGKSQLVAALLGEDSASGSGGEDAGAAAAAAATQAHTRRVTVSTGSVAGIELRLVDTPGLAACAADAGTNAAPLRAIRGAFRRYKPDLVVYVDRWALPLVHLVLEGGGRSRYKVLPCLLAPRPPPLIFDTTWGDCDPAAGLTQPRATAARWRCCRP